MKLKLLLILFYLSFFTTVFSQTVATQFGQVQGSLNGTVHQFLGIPFAKPPVGNLRWKAPQNPSSWSGTLLTNSFAPVCPQKAFTQGSSTYTLTGDEDCLYLNIWTPQTASASLPVMVFIHGGGNQQGSANEMNGGTQMYFGKNLSERGNVVVVTIQYRLGPLGFLVHPGLEPENANNVSGNYAAMDQILALQWVQNNISNFGGDPSKVMIFGESAGGVDVGNLLVSPMASGLFQRACIQSASPVLSAYNTARAKGISFVDSFIITGTDVQKIAFMRTVPSDSIIKDETPPLSGGAVGMNWQSVIDGQVFLNYPNPTFQSGNFNKVPLIIGSNSEEMSLSVPPTVTPGMVTLLINTTVPSSLQAQANLLYPPGTSTAQAKASYIGILSDAQFTTPVRGTAQCVSQNQTEPVWRYFFTHKHTIPALASYGSYHGMELFYVFNNWENATLGSGSLFKPQDDSVQNAMLQYWVNFASTGNPNGSGLPTWPQYQSANDCYVEIKATPNGSQCGLRTAKSDLWDAVSGFVPCTNSVGLVELSDNYIDIYPNPANDKLTVAFSKQEMQRLEIFNSIGVLVFSDNIDGLETEIDISNLSRGIYFVRFNSVTKKIIKE